MTPEQAAALAAVCTEFGVDVTSVNFRPDGSGPGWVGAFVGPAYASASPAGEVTLSCDCDPEVPYGTCAICPTCGSHLNWCKETRCPHCGACEDRCELCPGCLECARAKAHDECTREEIST